MAEFRRDNRGPRSRDSGSFSRGSRDSGRSLNRDSKPFERDSFGGSKTGTPYVRTSKGPMELFDAVCDKCGADCELPFKPRGGKPVYCRDCFRSQNEGTEKAPPAESTVEQFITINRKLDKIMRALKLD